MREMNEGLGVHPSIQRGTPEFHDEQTDFFLGAVTTNFKQAEGEVVPQYLKLAQKVKVGAQFTIAQIGFDARKSSELLAYMANNDMGHIPLIGNVFLLSGPRAKLFHAGRIPGVVVSSALLVLSQERARSEDKGRAWFLELAAKQMAIFRGLGFSGVYLAGIDRIEQLERIFEIEASFAPDDWKTFARELQYPQEEEFYLYARDEETGLAAPDTFSPEYVESLKYPMANHNVNFSYRMNRKAHDLLFTPGRGLYGIGKRIHASLDARDKKKGLVRSVEQISKTLLFDCKDCGDCSLTETTFLCPESQCAKNMRNGPCGGTHDGICEVLECECIWKRAYDRLKWTGEADTMLKHAPVIQDQGLRATSSWSNYYLGKDHQANQKKVPLSSIEPTKE
jgi:methylenetetrahydrofolate reductase (NADPH)